MLFLILMGFLAPLLARADPLDLYGRLSGKTILMPAALPALPDSITSDLPPENTNAIAQIERALSEKGLEVVQDGPHFVRVIPSETRVFMTNAPLRGAELAASKTQGPAGVIDFSSADLNQVLSIYAVLSQRTILRPATLPAPGIRLKTQSALTSEEAVYALATDLALNGICVVDDGAKFVQVVPRGIHAITRAPKPEPGAKLFDPKKVPSMAVPGQKAPAVPPRPPTDTERVEREFERLQKALYQFVHPPGPTKPMARGLVELYARLTGKIAAASPKFEGTAIWFRVETPLTKDELLYAIATTFALENLAIIKVDDHTIRLGHTSEISGNYREIPQPKW